MYMYIHTLYCGVYHSYLINPLLAATASVEGKMGKGLKKVLRKVFASDMQEQLAVADAKLGSAIKVRDDLAFILYIVPSYVCIYCEYFQVSLSISLPPLSHPPPSPLLSLLVGEAEHQLCPYLGHH